MANLQYIGARYVPKFFSNPDDQSNEWKAGVDYEALMIVTYNNDSYTSKIPVPDDIGDPASNPDYWACTTKYTAALMALQTTVGTLETQVQHLQDAITYITPEMFGAKGDGVTDDFNALQTCFNYAVAHKMGISAKTGAIYYSSQALTINNISNPYPFMLRFNNAQIKFDDSVAIDLTVNLQGDNTKRHHIIENLQLIGGSNSSVILYIDTSRQIEFNNCTIYDAPNVGVQLHSNQYEIYFNNCIVWCDSSAGTIAYQIDSTANDAMFNSCRAINCEIGFKVDGPGNMFIGCHIWTGLEGSVGFDIGTNDNVINGCTIDSFEDAIRLATPYVTITGCFIYAMYTSADRSTAPAFLSIPSINVKNYRKAIITDNYIRFKISSGFVQDGYFLREGDDKLFGNTANNMMFEQAINPNRINPAITSPDANVTVDQNLTVCEGDKCHLYLGLALTTPLAVNDTLTLNDILPDFMRPANNFVSGCMGKSNFYAGYTDLTYLYVGTNGSLQFSNKTAYSISYLLIDVTFDIAA